MTATRRLVVITATATLTTIAALIVIYIAVLFWSGSIGGSFTPATTTP